MYHVCVVGHSFRFRTAYDEKKVQGRIGHSVKFEWNFLGDAKLATWALANDDGKDTNQKIMSLDSHGADVLPADNVPPAYRGRVNGTRTGAYSSGQATFYLHNLRKEDQGLYCCELSSGNPHLELLIDLVQLVVVGMYLFRRTLGSSTRTRSYL